MKAQGDTYLIVLLTVIAAAMAVTRFMPPEDGGPAKPLTDLPMFHSAARAVSAHANAWNIDTLRQYSGDVRRELVNPFPYTPVIATVLQPVTTLTTAQLQPWWLALSCFFAACSCVLAWRIVQTVVAAHDASLWTPPYACMLVLPFQFALLNGQLDVIIGAVLLAAWWRSWNQPLLAGLLLALALCTKHALVPIIVLFLAAGKGPRQTVGYATLWSIGVVGMSVVFIGWQPWLQWAEFTLGFGTGNMQGLRLDVPFNLSVHGQLARWFGSTGGLFRVVGPVTFVMVFVIVAIRKSIQQTDHYGRLLWFGIGAVSSAWIMPFCWSHHLVVAAAPLLAMCFRRHGGMAPYRCIVGVLALQCAPGMPGVRLLEWLGRLSLADHLALAGTFGVLALLLVMTRALNNDHQPSRVDSV